MMHLPLDELVYSNKGKARLLQCHLETTIVKSFNRHFHKNTKIGNIGINANFVFQIFAVSFISATYDVSEKSDVSW